ncbi:4-hydroxyproline epimerase [Rosistilla oblonga]|uniref:4-hydroxyproline epimerase n=1 Tax=Rosistilla oblonga TaxID=2527990 RepID=UPI00118A38B0|nr:proline racemase family protein [Rosistilla oblonga]QDV13217.1 4-hydroxyproline epimerase [Rosistilla oblonga]
MSVDAAAIRVIDSHTGGEPTRLVVEGGPDLGGGPLPQRVERFRREADHFRTMMLAEPRGFDAMVGALLSEPSDPCCAAAVIFFNNRGYLGMCGHGAIGVVATLAYMGRIAPGRHRLETPVGIVAVELISPNRVAIENVPSYRLRKSVSVEVPGIGTVRGDIAWGGNWFYLVESSPLPVVAENIDRLSDVALRIRKALVAANITGADGAEIDHIELFGPPSVSDAHSRNFVLCPGGAYDRSPCGTGTSAKLACLAADGKLAPEVPWIQESIIGSRFTASYRSADDNRIVPRIVGEAYVYGETRFIAQPGDPFPYGIATA